MKIIVDGKGRYPGAFVECQPVPPTAMIVDNPVVVFKVLSDGTASTDLIDKNAAYRATPSIQRCVILQQARVAAVVFVRRGEDWLPESVAGSNATLHLPEIATALPLAEIYGGDVAEDHRAVSEG